MAEQRKRTTANAPARTPSDDHGAARVASGRDQSRAVGAYLEALADNRPRRGRKRAPASIDKQLAAVEERLPTASAISRLSLVQDRINLLAAKEALLDEVDLSGYEDEFVSVARDYGERKGISYAAWRELGVPAPVLRRAGIGRSRG